MCGIATIFSFSDSIDESAIERMTRRLQHRGPDAHHWVKLKHCHLGHTRLSIIDLADGSQPMSDETGRFWIVFNGEIFNYRELRVQLEKEGQTFRTQSDTEVLLRAYQQYGEKAVNHLNGQFAFVIWDQLEKKIFAARDRLGEKPLYWVQLPGGDYLFASEIKALLASGLVRPKLDSVCLDAYLSLLYVPPNRSIYENIHPLRPGTALTLENGKFRQWSYWRPVYSQSKVAEAGEVLEHLRFLLQQAVRRQMVADVPVGAFLSGGLDSSTVVALMSSATNESIRTFSVGFGDLINELPYAREVAEKYQTDHHEVQMNIPVAEMLERMSEVYDEPFADSSNIPTYLISGFARQHVKVVLAGDGADEVFGGYSWYEPLLSNGELSTDLASRLVVGCRSMALRILHRAGLAGQFQKDLAVKTHWEMRLKHDYPDFWHRHLACATGLKRRRSDLWEDEISETTERLISQAYEPGHEVQGLDRAVDFDVRCYLPGDILVKVDRAAMAHGLETRAPFLDVDLVEFVLGLPAELRFKNRTLKYLLRQSASDLWPETIRQRGKQGFGAPIANWIQRPDVRALLQRVTTKGHPLKAILPGASLILKHPDPQLSWTVLCLGLWIEKRSECLQSLS